MQLKLQDSLRFCDESPKISRKSDVFPVILRNVPNIFRTEDIKVVRRSCSLKYKHNIT